MTNNNKRKAKIETLNVPIPIPIELLYFLSKKGQYIVPNNIADQYAHVCLQEMSVAFSLPCLLKRSSPVNKILGPWLFLKHILEVLLLNVFTYG